MSRETLKRPYEYRVPCPTSHRKVDTPAPPPCTSLAASPQMVGPFHQNGLVGFEPRSFRRKCEVAQSLIVSLSLELGKAATDLKPQTPRVADEAPRVGETGTRAHAIDIFRDLPSAHVEFEV